MFGLKDHWAAFRQDLQYGWDSYSYDRWRANQFGYEVLDVDSNGHPSVMRDVGPMPEVPFLAYALLVYPLEGVVMLYYHLQCKLRGHQWEGHGHAGPDSGSEDFYCTRCGQSHHITYY